MRYKLLARRKQRVRSRIKKTNLANRLRLTIYRSNLHIYAQIIDDTRGVTITAASSLGKDFKQHSQLKNGGNKQAARLVGELLAKQAVDAGVKDLVFDRSGYRYHGRVKELAEAARQGGLNF